MTDWPIHIIVAGTAAPAGSKKAVPQGYNQDGTRRYGVVDANKKAEPWKANVGAAAFDQFAEHGKRLPLTCALDVEMIFYVKRPLAHFGTGRNASVLKDNAPLQPTKAPDVLKLTRGVEDALTGIVWKDDAQIVNEAMSKVYDARPRVEIRVRPTALTCVNDLIMMGQTKPPRPSELVPWEQLTLVA